MENKSLILAERIRLKYGAEIICFIILLGIFITVLVFLHELVVLVAIFSALTAILIIAFVFDMYKIYRNNSKPSILITYKNNLFTVYENSEIWKIKKSYIVDMSFKNKKSFIITPYFTQTSEWNYGKLILYVINEDNSDYCYKIKLKNVANPDRVFEKIAHILEWDTIED